MNRDISPHGLVIPYDELIERYRDIEYPMLKGETYLDHGGTTLYSRSLIENFQKDMMSNLFGNPHSASQSSQRSTLRIGQVRLNVLRFFNADPHEFEIVFVPNTTAGVKLIIEGFRESYEVLSEGGVKKVKNGFWYGYHSESHTSLVGVREFAEAGHRCFKTDNEVEDWLETGGVEYPDDVVGESEKKVGLFAYPGQSNMTGRRLPLSWPGRLRSSSHVVHREIYSLFDAAALASTAELDFSVSSDAPDFTVVSFYKIFGFPDLGAVIVKKDAGHLLEQRKYFGGGTVEMVINMKDQWHSMKRESLHQQLEDGTLPFHNIIALDNALQAHEMLYQSQKKVSEHTTRLAKVIYEGMSTLRHTNGNLMCEIYKGQCSEYGDSRTQGPIIAFNLKDADGKWIKLSELDKAANQNHIHLRTGDLCNPGGIARHLDLAPWELFRNYSVGLRCGCKNVIIDGKPSGVARVSLGAMNSAMDARKFLNFINDTYSDRQSTQHLTVSTMGPSLFINSLLIYPIRGCHGWSIPNDTSWEMTTEGMRWDKEWCLFDLKTKVVLTQKDVPRLALLTAEIDTVKGVLKVKLHPSLTEPWEMDQELHIPLTDKSWPYKHALEPANDFRTEGVKMNGVEVKIQAYTSPIVAKFFTSAFGVSCTLARRVTGTQAQRPANEAYGFLDEYTVLNACPDLHQPAGSAESMGSLRCISQPRRHLTSKATSDRSFKPPQVMQAEFMKANIVLAELPEMLSPGMDGQWRYLRIGHQLESKTCNRSQKCHLICLNPEASTDDRLDGVYAKVVFGPGDCSVPRKFSQLQRIKIKVGDSFSARQEKVPA